MIDLKFLTLLTFIMGSAISLNEITSDQESNITEIFEKVFVHNQIGRRVAQYLSSEDLKNTATAGIISEAAKFELNCRNAVLHWRNGKITPPFLAKIWKLISQINFTDNYMHPWRFQEHHWSPRYAILFGREKPLNITSVWRDCTAMIFTSQKDHLEILQAVVVDKNGFCSMTFYPAEIKGTPMNGLVFPQERHWENNLYLLSISSIYSFKTFDDNKEYWRNIIRQMKLAIVISSDCRYTNEKAENQALKAVKMLREDVGSIPICIVAQSDIRDESITISDWLQYRWPLESVDNTVLAFCGSNTKASTLVVNTEHEGELKKKFSKWKQELDFLDGHHQIIAFHFTVINGTEPENSEQIFSDIFKSIPLSSLCLLSGPSTIGVNYKTETESDFNAGPVYVIVGLRKFNCGY